MSSDQLCFSSSYPKFYYNLLLHDLFLFSSFILTHPLYFSYFIFFSPYLLKLLSFLSPLFITTSLLLLPLIIHHDSSTLKFSDHKPGFFLPTFLMIAEKLRTKIDGEVGSFEDFEVYKIVFDHTNYSTFDESPIEVLDTNADADDDQECVTKVCTHEVSSVISAAVQEERKLENFLELLDRFEKMANGKVEDKKVDHDEPPSPKSNKVARELQKEDLVRGSEATVIKKRDNDCTVKVRGTDNGRLEYTPPTSEVTSNVHPNKVDENAKDIYNNWECTSNSDSTRSLDTSLGSYGSMRKEREWKRTLACKLFEERHNGGGGGEEGMDSLWETHEVDSGKAKKNGEAKLKKKNRKKSGISEFYYDPVDEEDDEELGNGQICCLQALKLSSGKMNFGMGKPNLVKISKALKGIGWLHHVSRHGKKVTPTS